MEEILAAFGICEQVLACTQLSGGRIHGTYRVCTAQGDLIVQQMNPAVFPEPAAVMENIALVTAHIRRHFPAHTTLRFYRTADGQYLFRGWRVMDAIPGEPPAHLTPERIRAAGQAFGHFQTMLTGLDAARLHETLPGFHDTPARFAALQSAAETDPLGRLEGVSGLYRQLMALRDAACALSGQALPTRIIHGDTKLANILFDPQGKPLAVIDLDTVMPGLPAYDYGDAIRSLHADRDTLDPAILRDFTDGYLEGAAYLTAQERSSLLPGVTAVTAELAARYLTDHLTWDRYFGAADSAQRAAHLIQLANSVKDL